MTDQTKTPEQARADMAALFDNSIVKLTAALADAKPTDYVLAWPTGLGIGFKEAEGEYYVCGALFAEVVATQAMPEEAWAYVPIITNGAGERAQCVPRPQALQWALDCATEAKAFMTGMIAQHG